MTSEKTAIRHAAMAVLKAALPELNGRVYPNRTVSYEGWELPAVTVFTAGEEAEINSESQSRQYIRTATLIVQIAADGMRRVDDQLDALEDQVVQAIEASDDLNCTAGKVTLQAVRGPMLDTSGSRTVGYTDTVWEVQYYYDATREASGPEHALAQVDLQIETAPGHDGPEIEGTALPEQ